MTNNRNKLTIRIAGRSPDRIDVDSALKVINNTIALLRDADNAMHDGTARVQWSITAASMKSPLVLEITGQLIGEDESDVTNGDVAGLVLQGLRTLEASARRPRIFNDQMLMRARAIGAATENGLALINFGIGEREGFSPSPRLRRHVEEIRKKRPKYYITPTAIEGNLDKIDVHGKREFYIYDRLSDDAVRCFFAEGDTEKVLSLVQQRVRVFGDVRFNDDHEPISVAVRQFAGIPDQNELAQMRDLHKKGIDITGGKDSVEYIRGLRDAR